MNKDNKMESWQFNERNLMYIFIPIFGMEESYNYYSYFKC